MKKEKSLIFYGIFVENEKFFLFLNLDWTFTVISLSSFFEPYRSLITHDITENRKSSEGEKFPLQPFRFIFP